MLRLSLDTTLCNINTKPVPIGQQIRKIYKEESCRPWYFDRVWQPLWNIVTYKPSSIYLRVGEALHKNTPNNAGWSDLYSVKGQYCTVKKSHVEYMFIFRIYRFECCLLADDILVKGVNPKR